MFAVFMAVFLHSVPRTRAGVGREGHFAMLLGVRIWG